MLPAQPASEQPSASPDLARIKNEDAKTADRAKIAAWIALGTKLLADYEQVLQAGMAA